MKNSFVALSFSVVFVFSFFMGRHFQPAVPAKLTLASKGADEFAWNRFPCPDLATFVRLTKLAKVDTSAMKGEVCDDGPMGKLGRLLLFLQQLKINATDDWKGGADLALKFPFTYVAKSNLSIGLDFRQTNTIAYNENKSVYLGAQFFTDTLEDALDTLVHETRHSIRAAETHVKCRQGDIPFSNGACDLRFRKDKQAGAYAYAVSFLYGLAELGRDLTPVQREFLRTRALWYVGTRFNLVPQELAQPYEVITLLTDEGQVSAIHPFLLIPVTLPVAVTGEKIDRIEFENSNNGLKLFTTKNHAYNWTLGGSLRRFGEDVLAPDTFILDQNILPLDDDDYRYFIGGNNKIWYFERDPLTGKLVPKESAYQPQFLARRLIFAGSRYVLDDKGILYSFADNNTFAASSFQDPHNKGWIGNTGGLLFDELYGVNTDGELWHHADQENKRSVFALPAPAVKFQEAVDFRVTMDSKNNFYVAPYGSTGFVQITPPMKAAIIDFAVIRGYKISEDFKSHLDKPDPAFLNRCKIQKGELDPWLRKGLGINFDGQLIFEGPDGGCLSYKFNRDYGPAMDFKTDGLAIEKHPYEFSLAYLEVTFKNNLKVRLFPYLGTQIEVK